MSEDSQRSSSGGKVKSRRALRTQIQCLKWPPRKGEKIAFKTDFGVQIGILREIRQGLVRVDYFLEDGRIIPQDKLVICPEVKPWRDPDTVTDGELKACADRIRSRLKTGRNLMEDEAGWAEFCHCVMYAILKLRKDGERKTNGLGSAEPAHHPPS